MVKAKKKTNIVFEEKSGLFIIGNKERIKWIYRNNDNLIINVLKTEILGYQFYTEQCFR